MAKPGRNDICHCGSGRKYKKCHAPKDAGGGAEGRWLMFVVGGAVVAALAIGAVQFTATSQASGTRTWDPTHGHFHDANGVQVP